MHRKQKDPDAPLSKRELEAKISEMLLDPRGAVTDRARRLALSYLIETDAGADLRAQLNATVPIHRGIMVQLIAAAVGRGLQLPLAGQQRTAYANEAWNLILASDLYVRDRMAGDHVSPELAERILAVEAEAAAAESAVPAPADGLEVPEPTLTIADGGLAGEAPPSAQPKPVFDATGQLVGANPEE